MLYNKFQAVEEFLLGQQQPSKNNDLFSSTVNRENRRHSCFWSKDVDPLELPIFIVPFESDFETLFADVATFHPSFSPISAYVHVCAETAANALGVGSKKSGRSVRTDDRKVKLYLGSMLGEAVTNTLLDSQALSSANIGYASCAQTLSFSIARAKTLYPDVKIGEVASKWALAHKLTQKKIEKTIFDAVIDIHGFVDIYSSNVKGNYRRDASIDSDLVYGNLHGAVSESELVNFFQSEFDISEQAKALSGAFNERAAVFNSLVNSVGCASSTKQSKSACIAYYCNKILPGSFAHVGLLKDKVVAYPDIALWYAIYACLSPECNVRAIASGIGLKLIRDLLSPLAVEERPSCDISVDELEVLSRVSLKASVIKPKHRRLMRVSLLPGVDIEIAFGDAEYGSSFGGDVEVDQLDTKKIRSLLFEVLDLVENKGSRVSRSGLHVSRTTGKKR